MAIEDVTLTPEYAQSRQKFELMLNLRTTKALGIDIPPTLLALADEVNRNGDFRFKKAGPVSLDDPILPPHVTLEALRVS